MVMVEESGGSTILEQILCDSINSIVYISKNSRKTGQISFYFYIAFPTFSKASIYTLKFLII